MRTLTKIQVDAGKEGVEEEHEDDNSQDGNTLDQEDCVCYSVLWTGETCFSFSFLNGKKILYDRIAAVTKMTSK